MKMKTFTFAPIQADVRRQLKATHALLDAIDQLNALKEGASPDEQKRIDAVAKRLTEVTSDLMDNARGVSEFIRQVAS